MSTSRAPVNEEEFLSALYKGGELLAAGKIVEARSHLETASQLAPKNEKAQNLLGLTYFKLGLFDQASDIYERLVRENPADPTLRVNLGLVYLKTNNLPRCIKEFETATDLEPDHKKAHNYLGLALAQAGDYAKAREHFVLSGSEQMAEKMARALTTRVESSPSSHGMVVPPPPAATAQAVTAQPAQLVTPKPSGPPLSLIHI
ncbi:MAG: tetratricopeptide repeat protein [Myxococcus sp.]|nr:tetratricopeptide repeat protein [Myxococcus sp.]